jgi:RNA polymerase sigma-70 factor (ECF subfamily)
MADMSPNMDELLQRGYRYALSLAHDRHDAEELLQEACLSLVQSGGRLHVGSVLTAVRHRFIDRLRRRGLTMQSLDVAAEMIREVAGPAALTSELDAELERALGALRPEERELLYLAAVEEMTIAEIAKMTDRPRGTILSLIHRAKRKVRALLIAARHA